MRHKNSSRRDTRNPPPLNMAANGLRQWPFACDAYQAGSNSPAILAPFRFHSDQRKKRDELYAALVRVHHIGSSSHGMSRIHHPKSKEISSHSRIYALEGRKPLFLHQSCTITGLFPVPPVGRRSMMKAFEDGREGVWEGETFFRKLLPPQSSVCLPYPAEHWDASSKCRRGRRRSRCRIRCTDRDRKHTDTRRPPVFRLMAPPGRIPKHILQSRQVPQLTQRSKSGSRRQLTMRATVKYAVLSCPEGPVSSRRAHRHTAKRASTASAALIPRSDGVRQQPRGLITSPAANVFEGSYPPRMTQSRNFRTPSGR